MATGRNTGRHPIYDQLDEGRIPQPVRLLGWNLGRGLHLEDGRPHSEGRRGLPGIGLVEVIWKTATGVLNRHFTTDIGFYDTLHGFRSDRGTGTAYLESKLLQQLTEMR